MSISNLFGPNDYDLFCHSMTVSNAAPLLTDTLDTVNIGDNLDIGPVKAGVVNIGHIGIPTRIMGDAGAASFATDLVRSLTGANMVIGTSSMGLILQPNFGPLTIDQLLALSGPITIGAGGGATSVTISTAGVNTNVQGSLQLTTAGGVINYFSNYDFISDGQGCIPVTTNFVSLHAVRLNNLVTLSWSFIGVPTISTAASTLVLGTALITGYAPAAPVQSAAVLYSNGIIFQGYIFIDVFGVIQFGFIPGTHGASELYAIGEVCKIVEGTCTFSVV